MRIISSFKDYYDCGAAYGVDPKLPYIRKTECLNVRIPALDDVPIWILDNSYVLGFAGKVYPVFCKMGLRTQDWHWFYDFDSISDWCYDALRIRWQSWPEGDFRTGLAAFFQRSFDMYLPLFDEYKTAIFMLNRVHGIHPLPHEYTKKTAWHYSGLVLNPRLNDICFQTVFDPYSAWQELSMYVGNKLTQPVKPEPVLSDVVKAEKHGFDKHSFRKDKRHG